VAVAAAIVFAVVLGVGSRCMTPPPAGKSDRDKFERARNLKKHIVGIRAAITKASFACPLIFPLFFAHCCDTRHVAGPALEIRR